MIKINNQSALFLLVSILSLASAYFIEYILGYKPCTLCVYQRIPYLCVIIFTLINHKIKLNHKLKYVIYFAIFSASFILAIYHFGVENQIFEGLDSCSGKISGKIDNLEKMKDIIFDSKPSCNHADFTIFSISLAGWNAILSFILAYMSYNKISKKI